MSTPMHVIILDRASDEERESVQRLVREHANGWWHRFEGVWLVGGGTLTQWRDRIRQVLVPNTPSSVLVMKLPDKGERYWAYFGPEADKRGKWLHEHYTGKK